MFDDKIKNFLERERTEFDQHKTRIVGAICCLIVAVIFLFADFDGGDEVILQDNAPIVENAPDKNIDAVQKNSAVQQVTDKNVIPIIGANSETLLIRDPFKLANLEEEDDTEIKVEEDKKTEPPKVQENSAPPITIIQTSPAENKPTKPVESPQTAETFVLTGTAISGNNKTALVQHFKDKNLAETLILSIGDTLKGKRIVNITEDFLTLQGGEKLYLTTR